MEMAKNEPGKVFNGLNTLKRYYTYHIGFENFALLIYEF